MNRRALIFNFCFVVLCITNAVSARSCAQIKLTKCQCIQDNVHVKLKMLLCYNASFTDYNKDMQVLSLKDNITILRLERTDIIDKSSHQVKVFPWFQSLTVLRLVFLNVSSKDVRRMVSPLNHLQELELTHTLNISTLDSSVFGKRIPTLQTFQFNFGNITDIEKSTFKNSCPNLENLYLRRNKFTKVPVEAITPLKKLEYLNLAENDIPEIDSETVEKLKPNLKHLTELIYNMKCRCETYYSELRKWLVESKIQGVLCNSPKSLMSDDIAKTDKFDFCGSGAGNIKPPIFIIISSFLAYVMLFKEVF